MGLMPTRKVIQPGLEAPMEVPEDGQADPVTALAVALDAEQADQPPYPTDRAVQISGSFVVTDKPDDPRFATMDEYRYGVGQDLAFADQQVQRLEETLRDVKAHREELRAKVAVLCKRMGADPAGLLRGSGHAWTKVELPADEA